MSPRSTSGCWRAASGSSGCAPRGCPGWKAPSARRTRWRRRTRTTWRTHVVTAHAAAWQAFAAVAGRVVDGLDLYLHLVDAPGNLASDGLGLTDPEKRRRRRRSAPDFVAWFTRLFLQPTGPAEDTWMPSHLEYAVAGSPRHAGRAAGPRRADEYHGGHLDWYSLDSRSPRRRRLRWSRRRRRRRPAGRQQLLPHRRAVRRHAEHPLVDVRGRPDELRRRPAGHHRPRQAAAHRVRARLRQRLVPRCPPRCRWRRSPRVAASP